MWRIRNHSHSGHLSASGADEVLATLNKSLHHIKMVQVDRHLSEKLFDNTHGNILDKHPTTKVIHNRTNGDRSSKTLNVGFSDVIEDTAAHDIHLRRSQLADIPYISIAGYPDTGCGYDLVPPKEVAHLASRFKHFKEKVPFATAPGETDASHVLKTTVGATGEEMPCYVMDSDDYPAVMSVGRRCMAEGYLFIWPPGRAPFFVTPIQSHIVILEIEGLIPYMNDENSDSIKDWEWMAKNYGVNISNGIISMDMLHEKRNWTPNARLHAIDEPSIPRSHTHTGLLPSAENYAGIPDFDEDPELIWRNMPVWEESGTAIKTHDRFSALVEEIDAADEIADAPSASGLNGGSGHLSSDDTVIPNVEPRRMHQAGHTPTMARAGCDACMRGKSQNPPQFKGSLANTDRKIEKFGDVFTCGTSYMKDTWQERGVHGKSDSIVMKDVFTGFEGSDALTNKANEEALRALKHFKGADDIQSCYSDNADPIINACIDLNVLWEPSLQGKPDTNGVAEGQVKQSLNSIRTATVQAGFPGITWPWVGPCYCFNRNTARPDGPGTSKYFKRHGVEFEGHRLAPGTRVFFKPAPTKYKLSKTLPRLLGYRLGFGHRWRGDYMVADLDDFLELDLDQDAAPGPWGKVVPHITRKVEIPPWGIKHLLKEAYDLRNCTYDGRKDTTGVQKEALVATTPPEGSPN